MDWFENYPEELKGRIASGEIIDQKYWSFIKELNKVDRIRESKLLVVV